MHVTYDENPDIGHAPFDSLTRPLMSWVKPISNDSDSSYILINLVHRAYNKMLLLTNIR